MSEDERLTPEQLAMATETVLSFSSPKVQDVLFDLLTTETEAKHHRVRLKAMLVWERAKRRANEQPGGA